MIRCKHIYSDSDLNEVVRDVKIREAKQNMPGKNIKMISTYYKLVIVCLKRVKMLI